MLRRLTIESFALVEHVELEFDKGLTVLLGETGAGKSIIIDALSMALGERASADIVRKSSKKAIVEASFVNVSASVDEILTANGLHWEYDELVVRREITSSGTSRCFVNDTPTQLPIVRELAAFMIDFHGQHDTHGLLAPKSHRDILDRSTASSQDLRLAMRSAWEALRAAETELEHLRMRARDADADRARLIFLRDEVQSVNPELQEDESVSQELRRVESQEQIVTAAMRVRDALYAGEPSAYDLLRESKDLLHELASFDPSLENTIADLDTALIICKELAGTIAPLADTDTTSPERIEQLRQRLALLQRLNRKYGSIAQALDNLSTVKSELDTLENLEDAIIQAETAVAQAHAKAGAIAKDLHKLRKKHAAPLSASIQEGLRDMGMPSTTFEISISDQAMSPTGTDAVEFNFSSNPGEPPRQLSKVASGGELSRLMLAMKRALSTSSSFGTMVFDEIDTGISGRIARVVGEVMKAISVQQQIVCITHLPQIASLADQFVKVTKSASTDSTSVKAAIINSDEALVEVAKLLSGDAVSDVSLTGARELMNVRHRVGTK